MFSVADCYFWHPQGRRFGRNASVTFNQDGSVKGGAEDEDPAKKIERSKRFNTGGESESAMSQRLEKFNNADGDDGETERIIPGQAEETSNGNEADGDNNATTTTAAAAE